MLDCFPLYLLIALREALDPSNCVVHEVVYQILVGDLFLVDNLAGKPDDHLTVINEAGLHDFGKLRD